MIVPKNLSKYVTFHNMLVLHGEELAPCQTLKLEDHPLSDSDYCVVLMNITNVSEEPAESSFSKEVDTEAAGSSEMLVIISNTTQHQDPENHNLNLLHHKNLKS
jgi:hypothetical protein